jgi:hypothetical protein
VFIIGPLYFISSRPDEDVRTAKDEDIKAIFVDAGNRVARLHSPCLVLLLPIPLCQVEFSSATNKPEGF